MTTRWVEITVDDPVYGEIARRSQEQAEREYQQEQDRRLAEQRERQASAEARRVAYEAEHPVATVADLIAYLTTLPQDYRVATTYDDGYSVTSLRLPLHTDLHVDDNDKTVVFG